MGRRGSNWNVSGTRNKCRSSPSFFFAANIALLYMISSRRWPTGARCIVGALVPILCLAATLGPNLPDDWHASLPEPLSEFSPERFDETVIYAICLLLFYAVCAFIPIRAVSVIQKKLPSHTLTRFEKFERCCEDFLGNTRIRLVTASLALCTSFGYAIFSFLITQNALDWLNKFETAFSENPMYLVSWVGLAIFYIEIWASGRKRNIGGGNSNHTKFDFDKLFETLKGEYPSAILGWGVRRADRRSGEWKGKSDESWHRNSAASYRHRGFEFPTSCSKNSTKSKSANSRKNPRLY